MHELCIACATQLRALGALVSGADSHRGIQLQPLSLTSICVYYVALLRVPCSY